MSKKKFTQVIILCEDRQQEVFARYFLKEYGIDPKRMRVRIAPKGMGAGEQFVRKNYPGEVEALRSRSYLNIALVVVMDADPENSVDYRLGQLDDGLAQKRQPGEKIGIFIPKRNIETWIYYLKGNKVNEKKNYPKLDRESDCRPFVIKLADNCKNNKPLPQDAPDSLKRACNELQRIIFRKTG